jgi:hypothetical protein
LDAAGAAAVRDVAQEVPDCMEGTSMRGWPVPPRKLPTKTASQLAFERRPKGMALEAQGLLKSGRIRAALLKVAREDFIPSEYRDFAYEEVRLPLPGTAASVPGQV